jgi:hypothetical protein
MTTVLLYLVVVVLERLAPDPRIESEPTSEGDLHAKPGRAPRRSRANGSSPETRRGGRHGLPPARCVFGEQRLNAAECSGNSSGDNPSDSARERRRKLGPWLGKCGRKHRPRN